MNTTQATNESRFSCGMPNVRHLAGSTRMPGAVAASAPMAAGDGHGSKRPSGIEMGGPSVAEHDGQPDPVVPVDKGKTAVLADVEAEDPAELKGRVSERLLEQLTTLGADIFDDELVRTIHGRSDSVLRQQLWERVRDLAPTYATATAVYLVDKVRKSRASRDGAVSATTRMERVEAVLDKAVQQVAEALQHAALVVTIQDAGSAARQAKGLLWTRLLDRHIRPVAGPFSRFARRNGHDENDLCQEFFCRKFDRVLAHYDPQRVPLLAYLKRSLVRLFLDMTRPPGPAKATDNSPPTEDGAQPDRPPRMGRCRPHRTASPVNEVDEEEVRRVARAAVSAVCQQLLQEGYPYEEMLAFRLKELWGFKLRQIVALLKGCRQERSATSIWLGIQRTREAFRRRFQADYPDLAPLSLPHGR
jgi:hypothetical protein